MDDRRKDGGTNSTLRIKEQGTHLTLNEHDDNDDDDDDEEITLQKFQLIYMSNPSRLSLHELVDHIKGNESCFRLKRQNTKTNYEMDRRCSIHGTSNKCEDNFRHR